jgi:sulfoxide reductase heme-binding subunit YedZ
VKRITLAKIAVFLACLVPLARLVWKGYTDMLGANPIEVITHSTGDWTIIFLLITLSITPLRRLARQPWLIRFRRMTGLFAFFYACLHFTTYIWLDKFFDVHEMVKDVGKRPFITVGFTGFVLLIPLAVTSTQGMIRRLKKKWVPLHRLIYASACAGVIHYWWLVKADHRKPAIYLAILLPLLAYRVVDWARKRRKPAPGRVRASRPEAVSAD